MKINPFKDANTPFSIGWNDCFYGYEKVLKVPGIIGSPKILPNHPDGLLYEKGWKLCYELLNK